MPKIIRILPAKPTKAIMPKMILATTGRLPWKTKNNNRLITANKKLSRKPYIKNLKKSFLFKSFYKDQSSTISKLVLIILGLC